MDGLTFSAAPAGEKKLASPPPQRAKCKLFIIGY